jgi:hypothetical protein
MRSLYIFSLLIRTVLADWQGCITGDEKLSGKVNVVKGKETGVCLTVAIDSDNWAKPTDYRRFSFTPEADDYSRYVVDGCKSTLFEPLSNTVAWWPSHYSCIHILFYYTQPLFLFTAVLSHFLAFVKLVEPDFYSNVTAFASSQTSLSFQRKYYDKDVGIFPYLTAIIDVVDGVSSVYCFGLPETFGIECLLFPYLPVTFLDIYTRNSINHSLRFRHRHVNHLQEVKGIAWDDACVFCGKDKCLENTFDFTGSEALPQEPTKGCVLTLKECKEIHDQGGNTCDLRLYVVWTGTDKNGMYLTSSSKRFSAFSPRQIRDSFKDTLNKIKNGVSNTLN